MILECADIARVPAGSALGVDRELFAAAVTERVTSHPLIEVVREEATTIAAPCIVATGPLTSDTLASVIRTQLGADSLAFYDSIAPIVSFESIDGNRWSTRTSAS